MNAYTLFNNATYPSSGSLERSLFLCTVFDFPPCPQDLFHRFIGSQDHRHMVPSISGCSICNVSSVHFIHGRVQDALPGILVYHRRRHRHRHRFLMASFELRSVQGQVRQAAPGQAPPKEHVSVISTVAVNIAFLSDRVVISLSRAFAGLPCRNRQDRVHRLSQGHHHPSLYGFVRHPRSDVR